MFNASASNLFNKWIAGWILTAFCFSSVLGQDQESSEQALAVYADAANFQNNGAFDLAITEWKGFLTKFPKDPLIAKASHYLGICYMRKESPEYINAANAFGQALGYKDFEFIEEALSNRGWCLFVAGQNDQTQQQALYTNALVSFDDLLKRYPKTQFADQALFYSGEAKYSLGDSSAAVSYYRRLVELPEATKSPLYCDALYAAGVAYEELKKSEEAISFYNLLEKNCKDSQLIDEVHVRKADLYVQSKNFKEAASLFRKTANSKSELSAYALFRYAFCSVQLNDPDAAASAYDELMRDYPASQYAGAALMAAGQSYYRAGKFDEAAAKFREVLAKPNRENATEAGHWLAQILLRSGKSDEAVQITRSVISKGLDGAYQHNVKMDLADALSLKPETTSEAIGIYISVANANSKTRIGARALYNAAFSALQVSEHDRAGQLAAAFVEQYGSDPLLPDVLYISAESSLQVGKHSEASRTYRRLLTMAKDHPSRSLWTLRSATASYLAEDYEYVLGSLPGKIAELNDTKHIAEAHFIVGSCYLKQKKPNDAAAALAKSVSTNKQWPQAGEALLMLGVAQSDLGQQQQAEQTWNQVVRDYSQSSMASQARYRLAQSLSQREDYTAAHRLYTQILSSNNASALTPYAMYGAGWCLMKNEKFNEALQLLDRVLSDYAKHPVASDAALARGICLRRLGKTSDARRGLQDVLRRNPSGISLGHTLYELALLEVDAKQPAQASTYLKRLVNEAPEYPDLDKVLYELAWAMRDQGNHDEAIKHFGQLVSKYPNTRLAAEASYHVGQRQYEIGNYRVAASAFSQAAQNSDDPSLVEKAYYKLGWSGYQLANYDGAKTSFEKQLQTAPQGPLSLDGSVMIAESLFKGGRFQEALTAYGRCRTKILSRPENTKSDDEKSQQLRELVFLHGGQCAQQVKQWRAALQWFEQLRDLYPTTSYLPQVFYETGYCYQQSKDFTQAIQYYGQVAGNYRSEVAARARFMMGEIYFSQRELTKAIPEFQRVMYGFGGEKAAAPIKNWQAKSAFEAGRCGELLIQSAQGDKRTKAIEIASGFYEYVQENHPNHELVAKAVERLGVLKRL